MKPVYTSVAVLCSSFLFCSSVVADITEDNITATDALESYGTLYVDGQATLSGPVSMYSPLTIDDQAFTRWSGTPTGPYWNLLLEDGFFLWDDPNYTSDLDIDIPSGEAIFIWYPDKATFRVGESHTGMLDSDVGHYSAALGKYARAWATDSVAIGTNATSSGIGIGYYAISNGGIAIGAIADVSSVDDPIAIGSQSWTWADYGLAIGPFAYSGSNYGVTIGYVASTSGDGDAAIAIGKHSEASGERSVSITHRGEALAHSSVVIGSVNERDPSQSIDTWVATDELFVIANGVEYNPSNALVIYKNADAKFAGNISVAGDVVINPVGDIKMGDFE